MVILLVGLIKKNKAVVALSTTEAELYAEAAGITEVLWTRGLLRELGLHSRLDQQYLEIINLQLQ